MTFKFWRGATAHPAIIAFKGPTLLSRAGERLWTQYTSWPVRRLWGFALGRTIITIARCDGARTDRMEPR